LIYNLKLKLFIPIALDYFAELLTDFSYTNFTIGVSDVDALDRLRVHFNIILFLECFSDECPVLSFCSLSLKSLSLSSVNRIFFELVYVRSQCLVFLAKWHATLPVYRHCVKKILFTIIASVFVYKHRKRI